MAILAGIDEAGLGPKLGPLVLGLTVFRGPRALLDRLGDALAPVVGSSARSAVPVGDSKKLYGAGKRIKAIERGVLAFVLAGGDELPGDLRAWVERFDVPGGTALARLDACPWYRERLPLPRALDGAVVGEAARALAAKLAAVEASVAEIRVAALPAPAVNAGLAEHGSKNVLNFYAAAPLLRRLFDGYAAPGVDVEVVVDRQGGRKDYAPLLRRLFYPAAVTAETVDAELSAYLVRTDERRMRVAFMVRADARALPVSLASMAAKYTRELHMELFNRFWRRLAPEVAPTAGYPLDAARFLREIEAHRVAEGIGSELLVRAR